MLLIVGAPRSGTSWLAKIFDSHPEVLYRHEPDTIYRTRDFPVYCPPQAFDAHSAAARQYLTQILAIRTSKVVGSVPVFPKAYLSPLASALRGGWALSTKIGEQLPLIGPLFRRVQIPDLIASRGPRPALVMKSIAALGRCGLYLHTCPEAKAILIIRHPCGHIASVLRGLDMGKFDSSVPITEDFGVYEDLAGTREAETYGLDFAAFKAMSPIERLAWRWALSNEKAMNDLDLFDRARAIRYEDLCEEPERLSRELFDFAGLSWNDQTQAFLTASISHQGSERFYQVLRDPKKSASKWKRQLTAEQIDTIEGITSHTRPGRLFVRSREAEPALTRNGSGAAAPPS